MSEANKRRWRALQISRSWKGLLPRAIARRWAYREAFTVDGRLRVAAEHVLSDLRDFSFARTSAFDPDPIIMARRQGRRDVWLRISGYLELDEEQVQKLMEIDDGFG
jgi:hypothetical protein